MLISNGTLAHVCLLVMFWSIQYSIATILLLCAFAAKQKATAETKDQFLKCLDKLIEISVHLYTNTDDNGKQQFILGSKYSRGGKIAFVGIVIKEDSKGKKYYSHTIYKKISWRAQAMSDSQNGAKNLHPAVNSILHKILSVNFFSEVGHDS